VSIVIACDSEHDVNKLSAKIDAKVKALKKEVEAKFGNSAVENVQEAKKLFVNISKAVLVSGLPAAQSAPAAVATASSPSPITERTAATEEAVQPAAEETTTQEEEEEEPAAEKEVVEEAEQPSGEEKSDE
jgi:hypothetical protein